MTTPACPLRRLLGATAILSLVALTGVQSVQAGQQQYEPLSASVQASLQGAVSDRAPRQPIFASRALRDHWLSEMGRQLAKRIPDERYRHDLLLSVHYEATRAGLDPQLVLGLIQVESNFRKYAVSSAGARGYMQIMPFWSKLLAQSEDNLFHLRTNLRYGCTILRHYLDIEKGDLFRALGRYNGSLGKSDYPNKGYAAWQRWAYQPPPELITAANLSGSAALTGVWRTLRIALLLLVLATVALGAWRAQSRATSWINTLHVTIYPINADGRDATARHIAQLSARDFEPIAEWLGSEAQRYGISTLKPLAITLAPPRQGLPPQPLRHPSAWEAIVWSLQMRYWAWRNDDSPGPRPDVRLFVQYHDPALQASVQHSVGLEKGLIGLANVFASRVDHGGNLMVIAHEMLHTVGATDKYDPATLMPRFPDGYADPDQRPATPQSRAEIMAGRIPLTPERADVPVSLRYVIVGPATAAEIGWLRTP